MHGVAVVECFAGFLAALAPAAPCSLLGSEFRGEVFRFPRSCTSIGCGLRGVSCGGSRGFWLCRGFCFGILTLCVEGF